MQCGIQTAQVAESRAEPAERNGVLDGEVPLGPWEIATIHLWVEQGAKNN